ncbi:DnaB-like helicase C-terminal domain-containing protein [Mycobacterium sp.]|uniref:DnaB-like helicase C-terminal domain-containing protein n=1 Tax=Mycobacterium sp. TaxID=1785 RepID=UPI003BEEDD23
MLGDRPAVLARQIAHQRPHVLLRRRPGLPSAKTSGHRAHQLIQTSPGRLGLYDGGRSRSAFFDRHTSRSSGRLPPATNGHQPPRSRSTTAVLTIRALSEEATRLVRDEGIRMVVVDYLQLLSPDLRGETREREVGEIARELKALALDLGLPVVVAAQLNRGPEQRVDKKPTWRICGSPTQ